MKNYSEEIALRQIRANIAAGEGNENVDEALLSGVQADETSLRLANPATLKATQIATFFEGTPGITTQFTYESDNLDNPTLYIFVTDPEQADYLNRVIIHQHSLGGITLDVKVVQACAGDIVILSEPSDTISLSPYEILKRALKDNPFIIKFFEVYVPLFDVTYRFCETSPKVCYYQADDLSNVSGFRAALPVDLIKEVFDFNSLGCFVSTYIPSYQK